MRNIHKWRFTSQNISEMKEIIQAISNRDFALIIFIILILIAFLWGENIRESLTECLKLLFEKNILMILIGLCIWLFLSLVLMQEAGIWNVSLTKDTIFWVVGVGLPTLFAIYKAKNNKYFSSLILKAFKATFLLEFLINIFAFGLWIELILLPVLTILAISAEIAKKKPESQLIVRPLNILLSTIALLMLGYSISQILVNWDKIYTVDTLRTLLISFNLLLLFLPYLYAVRLYMAYESIFVLINYWVNDAKVRRKLRFHILTVGNININKVRTVSENVRRTYLLTEDNVDKTILFMLNKSKASF